jgi:hypothetical protein
VIRHVWSILCSKVSVDRETNNVSLFEILESVQFMISTAVTYPANFLFDANLVTLWARQDRSEPNEGEMRVRLLAPNGDQLAMVSNSFNFQSSLRARVIGKFNTIRVAGEGVHEWEISYRQSSQEDWRIVASIPLEISVQVVAPGEQPH